MEASSRNNQGPWRTVAQEDCCTLNIHKAFKFSCFTERTKFKGRSLVIVFTTAHHCALPWGRWTQLSLSTNFKMAFILHSVVERERRVWQYYQPVGLVWGGGCLRADVCVCVCVFVCKLTSTSEKVNCFWPNVVQILQQWEKKMPCTLIPYSQ
jgi:hypothetical protein